MKSISGKRLVIFSRKKGWVLVDVNGSYFKYCKSNQTVIIPIHGNKDLRIGILKSLMKQANLTEDYLI